MEDEPDVSTGPVMGDPNASPSFSPYQSPYSPYGVYGGYPMHEREQKESSIDTKLTAEDASEIWDGRRRMSWVALISMILPTFYIIGFITDDELVREYGNMLSWFYLALASVVCAYFGFRSWSSIRGK